MAKSTNLKKPKSVKSTKQTEYRPTKNNDFLGRTQNFAGSKIGGGLFSALGASGYAPVIRDLVPLLREVGAITGISKLISGNNRGTTNYSTSGNGSVVDGAVAKYQENQSNRNLNNLTKITKKGFADVLTALGGKKKKKEKGGLDFLKDMIGGRGGSINIGGGGVLGGLGKILWKFLPYVLGAWGLNKIRKSLYSERERNAYGYVPYHIVGDIANIKIAKNVAKGAYNLKNTQSAIQAINATKGIKDTAKAAKVMKTTLRAGRLAAVGVGAASGLLSLGVGFLIEEAVWKGVAEPVLDMVGRKLDKDYQNNVTTVSGLTDLKNATNEQLKALNDVVTGSHAKQRNAWERFFYWGYDNERLNKTEKLQADYLNLGYQKALKDNNNISHAAALMGIGKAGWAHFNNENWNQAKKDPYTEKASLALLVNEMINDPEFIYEALRVKGVKDPLSEAQNMTLKDKQALLKDPEVQGLMRYRVGIYSKKIRDEHGDLVNLTDLDNLDGTQLSRFLNKHAFGSTTSVKINNALGLGGAGDHKLHEKLTNFLNQTDQASIDRMVSEVAQAEEQIKSGEPLFNLDEIRELANQKSKENTQLIQTLEQVISTFSNTSTSLDSVGKRGNPMSFSNNGNSENLNALFGSSYPHSSIPQDTQNWSVNGQYGH